MEQLCLNDYYDLTKVKCYLNTLMPPKFTYRSSGSGSGPFMQQPCHTQINNTGMSDATTRVETAAKAAKATKQAHDQAVKEGLSSADLEFRLIIGFLTAKEAYSFKLTPSSLRIQLLKRISNDQLNTLSNPSRGEPKEQVWTEEEILSFRLNVQTISSSWFVGVEAEWDEEWWADHALDTDTKAFNQEYSDERESPISPILQTKCQPPLDRLNPGVKLMIVTVAYFDHADNWMTHKHEEPEGLVDFHRFIKVSRGAHTTSNASWIMGGGEGRMDAFRWWTGYDTPYKMGTDVQCPSKKGVNGEIEMYKEYYWGRQFNRFYLGGYRMNLS
ncbi:hypothetical protein JCM1840_002892 [Sporobolomyces johnsonii]